MVKSSLLLATFLLTMGLLSEASPAKAPALQILSQWVLPTRTSHNFELRPHERTRPIVMGDIIYFAGLQGEVYAMHRTENYVLWHKKLPGSIEGAFTYGRSKLFVGDSQGNLFALNARDGSEAWKFKVQAEWLSPPVVLRDRVYVVTSSDDLYALGESQGKEIWHYSHRGDEKMTVRGTGGTVVYGDEVFQGFSDGYIVSLSSAQGKVLWTKKLRTKERFYDVDTTPYVDDQSVIVATFDGKLFNLDRLTSNVKWTFPTGAYGGVYVEDGRVYFTGLDHQFYAVDRNTGQVIWKIPLEKGVGLAPSRLGAYLVVPMSSDPVYLIDTKLGRIAGTVGLGTGTMAPAAITSDGYFYCMSDYGNLYSFEVREPLKAAAPLKGVLSTPSAIERPIEAYETNSAT